MQRTYVDQPHTKLQRNENLLVLTVNTDMLGPKPTLNIISQVIEYVELVNKNKKPEPKLRDRTKIEQVYEKTKEEMGAYVAWHNKVYGCDPGQRVNDGF
jgi:hypothetical protein